MECEDSTSSRIGPLENNMSPPDTFDIMVVAHQLQFDDTAEVCYPRCFYSGILPGKKRLHAPMPLAAQASSGHRAQKTTLRECLMAFLCCRGITFFSQNYQLSDAGSTLALSTKEELILACKTKRVSTKASSVVGPHNTQGPRSIAITLLLPRSCSSRRCPQDEHLLNAFAAICQSTQNPISLDSFSHASDSAKKYKLTSKVRLNVACGEDDVGQFLKHVDVETSSGSIAAGWDTRAAVCVSFVKNSSEICTLYSIIEDDGVLSNQSAIHVIQKAVMSIQSRVTSFIVLPNACTNAAYVQVDKADFLALQHDLQTKFKAIFLPNPVVNVQDDVVHSFKQSQSAMDCDSLSAYALQPRKPDKLVRVSRKVSTNDGGVALADECTHSLGSLFYTDEELFYDYLRRFRLGQPWQPFCNSWPIYGLGPMLDSESFANVSVLYPQISKTSIGNTISLFFPRRRIGEPVTEFENSIVLTMQCFLERIDAVLGKGFLVLPCTFQSAVPRSPFASSIAPPFAKFISAARSHVLKANPSGFMDTQLLLTDASQGHAGASSSSVRHCVSFESELSQATVQQSANNDNDDEEATFFGSLLCAELGHPVVTCGDALDVLQTNTEEMKLVSSGFNALVVSATQKFGRGQSLKSVLDACATIINASTSMEELLAGLTLKTKKDVACSTVECGGGDHPRKRVREDDITARFVIGNGKTSLSKFLNLANFALESRVDYPHPLVVKSCLHIYCKVCELLVKSRGACTDIKHAREDLKALGARIQSLPTDNNAIPIEIIQLQAILESVRVKLAHLADNVTISVILNSEHHNGMFSALLSPAGSSIIFREAASHELLACDANTPPIVLHVERAFDTSTIGFYDQKQPLNKCKPKE